MRMAPNYMLPGQLTLTFAFVFSVKKLFCFSVKTKYAINLESACNFKANMHSKYVRRRNALLSLQRQYNAPPVPDSQAAFFSLLGLKRWSGCGG